MKFPYFHNCGLYRSSLPTRGGWIEITAWLRTEASPGSLPTRGGWIEIWAPASRSCWRSSLPTRGGWIEMTKTGRMWEDRSSLPTRGGWIEMYHLPSGWILIPSPSPHGEGGLKSDGVPGVPACQGPSPHGEGGLKSTGSIAGRTRRRSLPTRGGWIEIPHAGETGNKYGRPSPHGEGGLKLRWSPV